jgi:hypothetical protein
VGLLSAKKENAHVSLGPEYALLGAVDENVPLSVYKIVPA